MRSMKSERLKKFETELHDLEQWLKLGLVPKKDVEKHKEEISSVRTKLDEERERLQFLKESGESEDYVAPKRNQPARSGYTDMQSIPDIDAGETTATAGDGFRADSEFMDMDTALSEEDDDDNEEQDEFAESDDDDEDEESYFSDKNRWKRGDGIVDPDDDRW